MTGLAPAQPSLGALLLGCPPAPGFSQPADELPEPWKEQFVSEHTSAAVFSGLFTSNTAGRRWTLQTAPVARLTLQLRPDPAPELWGRQLAVVRQCLALRGDRPVRLVIIVGQVLPLRWALDAVPQALSDVSSGITAVEFRQTLSPVDTSLPRLIHVSVFLRQLATILPNLTTLTLHSCPAMLPTPSQAPRLRQLSMDGVYSGGSCPAVGELLHQLTSFSFHFHPNANVSQLISFAFTTHGTSHTLTHFSTDTLDSQLTDLLLRRTPALTHLTVSTVQLTEDHSSQQWAVQHISISTAEPVTITGQTLAHLPTSKSASKTVVVGPKVTLILEADNSQGLDTSLCGRLHQWVFDGLTYEVRPAPILLAIDHPPALHHTLRQLSAMQTADPQAGKPMVWLSGWQWTTDMGRRTAEYLPALPQLAFGLCVRRLDDTALCAALDMGAHVCRVRADSLALQSDHSGRVWQWEGFVVGECSAASLPRLPRPSTAAQPPTLNVSQFTVKSDVITAGVNDVCSWLHNVRVSSSSDNMTVSVVYPQGASDADTLAALSAQLAVLRAIQFTDTIDLAQVSLVFRGWSMSEAVVEALQGLPPWQRICFEACVWPEGTDIFYDLACYVPLSFEGCDGLSEQVPGDHTGLSPSVMVSVLRMYRC